MPVGSAPVEDPERLLRFVPDSQLVPDSSHPTVQSEMFRKQRFSVDREGIKPLARFRAEHAGLHVARFGAVDCRVCGFGVEPDPLADNEAHAVVITDATGNQLRRMAKRLRDEFVTLLPPEE
jgi:hypothetical protein